MSCIGIILVFEHAGSFWRGWWKRYSIFWAQIKRKRVIFGLITSCWITNLTLRADLLILSNKVSCSPSTWTQLGSNSLIKTDYKDEHMTAQQGSCGRCAFRFYLAPCPAWYHWGGGAYDVYCGLPPGGDHEGLIKATNCLNKQHCSNNANNVTHWLVVFVIVGYGSHKWWHHFHTVESSWSLMNSLRNTDIMPAAWS